MALAKAKHKVRTKVKTAKKATAKSAAKVRRAAKKSAPRRRVKTPSLAKEFSALADKITSFGKAVFEQGTEKAGEIARAALSRTRH